MISYLVEDGVEDLLSLGFGQSLEYVASGGKIESIDDRLDSAFEELQSLVASIVYLSGKLGKLAVEFDVVWREKLAKNSSDVVGCGLVVAGDNEAEQPLGVPLDIGVFGFAEMVGSIDSGKL